MSNEKSLINVVLYADILERAKGGDERAITFLRSRIVSMAPTMSVQLLLMMSGTILEFRRNELTDEAANN